MIHTGSKPGMPFRGVRWIAFAAALLLVGVRCALAGPPKERWFTMELAGAKAGWMRTVETTTEASVTMDTEMRFSLSRGEQGVRIVMTTQSVETPDGKPVSMKSVQHFGRQDVTTEYSWTPDGVRVTTAQPGAEPRTETKPLPAGVWLTPAAAERYARQRFVSGAKEIEVRTIDPSNGLTPLVAKRSIGEKCTIKALGRSIEVTKTTVTSSAMAGVSSVEFLDGEGELVKGDTAFGGFTLTMTACTREQALEEGKAAKAPEMMVSTFVRPDRPIEHARTARHAVLVLSVPDGRMPDLPTTGAQTPDRIDEKSVRLTIDASTPNPAPEADATDARFTAPSAMIDGQDQRIRDLAAKATAKSGDDPARRAEDIRRFVHTYIRAKNLGVGLATATEVAQTREGDCTEHAVLTAAMLRGAGIPSRVAVGLIYADSFAGSENIFGYHMWAQGLLNVGGKARWVDLDATLPAAAAFDATHIAVGVTELAEADPGAAMLPLATILGRVSIRVETADSAKGTHPAP